MKILAVESSCDESAVAIFDSERGVLEDLVHSQIDLHALYGGVVPDLASSEHLKKLPALIGKISKSEHFAGVDKVVATRGPGLPNCLAMGISAASALAAALGVPLFGVNHLRAHAYSPFIKIHARDPKNFDAAAGELLPHLGLAASGGNTVLFEIDKSRRLRVIADTEDDAAGEALDKGAKLLGMPYPGAPLLEKIALGGKIDKAAFSYGQNRKIEDDPDFSFSGLKTSLRYRLEKMPPEEIERQKPDICASYQFAVVEQLRRRADFFAARGNYASVGISGGVSNNAFFAGAFEALARKRGAKFLVAERAHRGDNAAMIAFCAFFDPASLAPAENKTLKMDSSLAMA
ncbi:MAG: tRNA (adenosine(37)-N6)-threonylcarbamoyltransferase complex transferase subunit TsaD [Opitutales bacterium]|nr:tRNA (adenosine(37)-N6)-threonylcarbamoyltransferase complex transferase subunit TsaD [Opitutales bacterium]